MSLKALVFLLVILGSFFISHGKALACGADDCHGSAFPNTQGGNVITSFTGINNTWTPIMTGAYYDFYWEYGTDSTYATASGSVNAFGGSPVYDMTALQARFGSTTGHYYAYTIEPISSYTTGNFDIIYAYSDSPGHLIPFGPSSTPGPCDSDPSTRILSMYPGDGDIVSSTVAFTLDACMDPADVTGSYSVKVTLHNIDQNVLIPGFSQSDLYLINGENITTSGEYNPSITPVLLPDGNYRLNVVFEQSYLWGLLQNPFTHLFVNPFTKILNISHSFIVNHGTFIGNLSNNIFSETNSILGGYTSTKTASQLAKTCNPLDGDFDLIQCLHFLFVPDGQALAQTLTQAKDGIFTRMPWGYLTRFITILSSTDTVDFDTYSHTFPISGSENLTIGFNPGEILTGAGEFVDSIHDPLNPDVNFKDTFGPMIKLVIALGVIITIAKDLMGSHQHENEGGGKNTKLS